MTLVELLRRHEGCRNKPYTDTVGKLTVGIGHNLTDNGLSDAAINFILHEDIRDVEKQLDHHLPWWRTIPPSAAMALEDMAFNMGVAGLLEFTHALGFLEAGDYDNAAKEFLNSKWAQQVGNRAIEDSKLIKGTSI